MLIKTLVVITVDRIVEIPDAIEEDFKTISDHLVKVYKGFEGEGNGTTAFDFKEIGIVEEQKENEK